MPRSKGLEVFQERVPSYRIQTSFEDGDSTFERTIRRTKVVGAKIRLPLANREHFKFLVGLSYAQQEFAFQNPETLSNAFHQSLQDKSLISGGIALYSINSFVGNKYLAFRGTFRLNGDFDGDQLGSHQKSTIAGLLGFKIHRYKAWGVGLSYSNTFGRASIYPLLFYNQKYNEKWGLELVLPVSVKVLFQPNDRNTFYFQNQLEGDNYNINLEGISQESLFLEKADFKSFFTYEREVYDFIWVYGSGGMRFNVNFDVSDSDAYFDRNVPIGTNDNLVISNHLSRSLFFRFGLFLVPPRSWLQKNP